MLISKREGRLCVIIATELDRLGVQDFNSIAENLAIKINTDKCFNDAIKEAAQIKDSTATVPTTNGMKFADAHAAHMHYKSFRALADSSEHTVGFMEGFEAARLHA